jgi:hypothetical protein
MTGFRQAERDAGMLFSRVPSITGPAWLADNSRRHSWWLAPVGCTHRMHHAADLVGGGVEGRCFDM